MIKAILVDDEMHGLRTLSIHLADYCPQVEVLAKCSSAKSALEEIKEKKPDLVFLDIEMPVMNGFELLEQFDPIPFAVILRNMTVIRFRMTCNLKSAIRCLTDCISPIFVSTTEGFLPHHIS